MVAAGWGESAREPSRSLHHATTLDRAKLSKSVGALPSEVLEEVELGLKAAMAPD
jgi:hypothetical protein